MSHFIICSLGKTGSFWIANALDINPDIICTHSNLHVPASEIYLSGWNGFETIGAKWKDKKPSEELAKTLTEKYGKAIEKESKVFSKYTLDEYFDLQEKIGIAKYYGNAHGYTLTNFLNHWKANKPNRKFKLANLHRHPLKIVESGVSRSFVYEDPQVIARIKNRTAIDKAVKAYKLKLCPEVIAFIDNCNKLPDYLGAMRCLDLLHIPIERITQDKEYFCFVLRYLTSDDIEISDKYLDSVFSLGKLNRHNKNRSCDNTPEILFSKWDYWQRDYFSKMLSCFQDIFPKAEELGYNFSNFLT